MYIQDFLEIIPKEFFLQKETDSDLYLQFRLLDSVTKFKWDA